MNSLNVFSLWLSKCVSIPSTHVETHIPSIYFCFLIRIMKNLHFDSNWKFSKCMMLGESTTTTRKTKTEQKYITRTYWSWFCSIVRWVDRLILQLSTTKFEWTRDNGWRIVWILWNVLVWLSTWYKCRWSLTSLNNDNSF